MYMVNPYFSVNFLDTLAYDMYIKMIGKVMATNFGHCDDVHFGRSYSGITFWTYALRGTGKGIPVLGSEIYAVVKLDPENCDPREQCFT